jgi:hypothetical protein
MTTIQFLAEWALRSSVLILAGTLLLWLLRIKDPSVRLAACIAMLCGSLAVPMLTGAIPHTAVPMPVTVLTVDQPLNFRIAPASASVRPDWPKLALFAYGAVAAFLLLRLATGLAIGRRLARASTPAGRTTDGIEIRCSDRVSAPVTLGVARSVIVLPAGWQAWDDSKLEAVLAHESSHVRRRDPVVQMLSALHRSLLWFSPLSWFLHARIVRLAEDASDDAALRATNDRVSYAELLLDFIQRGVRRPRWQGVAMARYGGAEDRIHRILDGTTLSCGLTRAGLFAIVALGAPLVYFVASAQAQAPAVPPAPPTPPQPASTPQTPSNPAATPQVSANPQSGRIRRYMIFNGDSTSGSWDSSDSVDEAELRARFGRNFAWFRQSGHEYVITDSSVLKELDQAMEPQREVNRMQEHVNQLQAGVNALQGGVNGLQNEINAMQQKVNRRQDLVNRIQASVNSGKKDELLKELEAALQQLRSAADDLNQESVNLKQAEINQQQARVNARQHEVNAEQQKVNAEQQKVNNVFRDRIQQIFDSAIRRGLARQLM